jgi:hypothetical protein
MRALFEPWSLGDAVIAASVGRLRSADTVLVCDPAWHSILRAGLGSDARLELRGIRLSYTGRGSGRLAGLLDAAASNGNAVSEVVSIRGDVRDWWAARRAFPRARLRFTGWVPFVARRSRVADLPFARGLLPVQNRYFAWADALGIGRDALLRGRLSDASDSRQVLIHVGAQWRSKQYPHVAALRREFESRGLTVKIVAGPRDALPEGIGEGDVSRLVDLQLVDALKVAGQVVANDSGPMHLAAFLGARTVALGSVSNLVEWLPPGVTMVVAATMPHGYRPRPGYQSDRTLGHWPAPDEVVRAALGEGASA